MLKSVLERRLLVFFMVAAYGGVSAFIFNKKVMGAEALFDEFKEYMLTRANTYSLVSEIMGDQIDDTWSIAEFAAKSESTDLEEWSLLHNAVLSLWRLRLTRRCTAQP